MLPPPGATAYLSIYLYMLDDRFCFHFLLAILIHLLGDVKCQPLQNDRSTLFLFPTIYSILIHLSWDVKCQPLQSDWFCFHFLLSIVFWSISDEMHVTCQPLQNAYNLGMQISLPSPVGTPSGTTCASITCSISDIDSFCQAPNTLTGAPGEGCYNTDGTGTSPTSGTEAFANACPEAYSYSKDDTNHVYGCPTTSTYQVEWCPS